MKCRKHFIDPGEINLFLCSEISTQSVFLESSPEETKERRIRRNRDENAASPFICRVVELEQEKLEVQRKNAGIIVGKDGRVYEQ